MPGGWSGFSGRISPVFFAPFRRRCEPARPHPKAPSPGQLFSWNIACAVGAISQRPAQTDHPGTQVLAEYTAEGDYTPVSVRVLALTGDHALPDPGIQNQSRFLSAAIVLALAVQTHLPALGCVDAKQTDTLAPDLEGVAVDHCGTSCYNLGGCRTGRGRGDRQPEHEGAGPEAVSERIFGLRVHHCGLSTLRAVAHCQNGWSGLACSMLTAGTRG